MFSSINNWLGKKKEDFPQEHTIKNLEKGCIFEYDLRSWKVLEVNEYDWGDSFYTVEYKITDGNETAFLHVEDDDELLLTLSKPESVRKIDSSIPQHIASNEEPPEKLTFNGKEFFLESENPGYFKSGEEGQWTEFISWNYFDQEEKHTLCIEQWGEKSFEASTGIMIKEHQITNILPAPEKG